LQPHELFCQALDFPVCLVQDIHQKHQPFPVPAAPYGQISTKLGIEYVWI
jgi:hypothetical protein